MLFEMRFEQARTELEMKKTGDQAPKWLEENQDKPLEELQASKATGGGTEDGEEEGAASIPAGATASSLVCIELGKKLSR
ncbi:hypothetical protein P885DRAFT_77571 [Corynascus similis CBS 632.67]